VGRSPAGERSWAAHSSVPSSFPCPTRGHREHEKRRGPCGPRLSVSAEGVDLGGCGLCADGAGRGDRGLVGLPFFTGQLVEGVNGAGCGGVEGKGGEAGLGGEFAGAGCFAVEAGNPVPIFVAVLVGELHGHLAGDRDLAGVEGGGAVARLQRDASDPVKVFRTIVG
jgi:hypothetical protein